MVGRKVKLGEVAEIISGATPSRAVPDYWDGGIPWVTPKELAGIRSRYIETTQETISELGLSQISARLLPVNSVLLSSRAPIGHIAVTKIPMATNQGFKSFIPNAKELDSDFLYYWLRSTKEFLQSLGRGATFKEISKSIVENIEIPLPSLAEQRRIAVIFDKVDELSALRRQALARLNDLAQSVFTKAASDSLTTRKIGDLSTQIRGVSYKKDEVFVKPTDGAIPVLRATNIQDGSLLLNELVFVISKRVSSSQLLIENDILIAASSGSLDVVGKAARVPNDTGMGFGAFCKVLRPSHEIEPLYFAHYFQSPLYKQRIKSLARGANINNLRNEDLDGLEIPLPTKESQTRFAKFAKSLETTKLTALAQLREVDKLHISLQQEYFN